MPTHPSGAKHHACPVCQDSGTLIHAQYKALVQSNADRAQLVKTNESLLRKIANLERRKPSPRKLKAISPSRKCKLGNLHQSYVSAIAISKTQSAEIRRPPGRYQKNESCRSGKTQG